MSCGCEKLDTETIFRSYRERIHRHIAYMVRDPELARDLTQETFLRAHRELVSLQDSDAVAVWLYRIATRLCVDAYRRAFRDPQARCQDALPDSDAEDDQLADADAPPLQLVIEQAEMSACVRTVVDDLPESYRAVLLLQDLEGMTGREVAERLGCSLPTVKIRLHRARRRLEEALRSECHVSCDERGVVVCEPKRVTRLRA